MRGEADVEKFAEAMLNELRCNAHKGDYRAITPDVACHEAAYHLAKLALAATEGESFPEAVLEYAADVGNAAMQVAISCGALERRYLTDGHAEDRLAPWRYRLPFFKRRTRKLIESAFNSPVKARTATWKVVVRRLFR